MTVLNIAEIVHNSIEFFNFFELPGVPSYKHSLKARMVIVSKKSLSSKVVQQNSPSYQATSPKNHQGNYPMLGRQNGECLHSQDHHNSNRLNLCIHAMTISKVQGQSLMITKLNLNSPCFPHLLVVLELDSQTTF